jgi:GntR family transcriptional repressor for pyruvate dehydrogenase complex
MLTPVNAASLPELVAQRLLDFIAMKNMAVGDLLPPHRELAERLEVSRPVLRAALHRLEERGVVAVRHGSGTRVTDRVPSASVTSLLDGFSHSSALAILEARMVIDVELAALAAERADDADLKRLEEALERIRLAANMGKPTVRDTSAFHQQVALAARSPVLLEFYERLRLPMQANGRRIVYTLPETNHAEYENHRDLFEALCTRDPDTARQAMRQHLRKAHSWEESVARLRGELVTPASTERDKTWVSQRRCQNNP